MQIIKYLYLVAYVIYNFTIIKIAVNVSLKIQGAIFVKIKYLM